MAVVGCKPGGLFRPARRPSTEFTHATTLLETAIRQLLCYYRIPQPGYPDFQTAADLCVDTRFGTRPFPAPAV